MTAAITKSDNASAETVWASLGDPVTAAKQVEEILQETGDPTTVQSRKLRPEFSAFGQTDCPLLGQVRFVASAFCNSEDGPIFSLMSRVEPDQRLVILVTFPIPNSKEAGAHPRPGNISCGSSGCSPPRWESSPYRSRLSPRQGHSMMALMTSGRWRSG